MPSRRRLLGGGLGLLASLAGCTGQDSSEDATDAPGATTAPATDDAETPTAGFDSGPSGPWPTFRGNAANTAVTASGGPTTAPSVLWQGRAPLDADSHPVPAPEGVYAPSGDGHLYALTDEGEERWRARIGERPWTPAVADGQIVVPTREALLGFSPDGAIQWEYRGEGFFQQPAFLGETVVAGRFGGGAALVDASDGTSIGRVGGESRAYAPVVRNDTAYVALSSYRDRTGGVVAVAPDGTVRWRAELDARATSRVGFDGGTVYAGTNSGNVYALDAATGERLWRASVGEWVTRGPTAANGRVFAVTLRQGLVALDADGSVRWRGEEVNASTDPVVADSHLLCDHERQSVVALDPADGSADWRLPTDGRMREGVRADGSRAVVGTGPGTVQAFDPERGEERWRFTTKPRRFASPVVGQRFAYLGSRSNVTTGYVLEKGKRKWSVSHSGLAPDAPAVVDSLVVSASQGGDVDATRAYDYPDVPSELTPTPTEERGTTVHVDPPPPEKVWTTALDAGVRSSVSYADGTAVVGTDDGIAALEVGAGEIRWHANRGAAVESTPAIADGTVVAGANDGTVAGLALGDGKEYWTVTTGDAVVSSPAIRAGVAYVGSDDGNLYALDLADGSLGWQFETGGPVVSSPAVAPGVAVVGSADGRVYAVETDGGERRWTFETDGPVYSSPAIADETVYVGSRDGHVYALALADGRERWRFAADNWVDSSPAVAYGAVFVADQAGNVYALVD